jgi:hypothetical protein
MSDKLQPGFHTNLDDFCSELDKDINFVPFGELQHSFTTDGMWLVELNNVCISTKNQSISFSDLCINV